MEKNGKIFHIGSIKVQPMTNDAFTVISSVDEQDDFIVSPPAERDACGKILWTIVNDEYSRINK